MINGLNVMNKTITKELKIRLSDVKGFVFDMDGTLLLGDKKNNSLKVLPGAVELTQYLTERSIPYVVFTNGTTRAPKHYASVLRNIGINVADENMLTPASSAADLFAKKGYKRVLILGGEGLAEPLADKGIEPVLPGEGTNVDAVLVGWHPEFGMSDIEAACEAVWAGAKLYSASQVIFFASANGRALGTSRAICSVIKDLTGCRVELVGKPSIHAVSCAAGRLGIKAKEMAVVGDDPDLEVPMGHRAKGMAIAVDTGLCEKSSFQDLPENKSPHLYLRGVDELHEVIDSLT